MKRFSFPLDRVLDWKGVIAQQEQLTLDSLHRERDGITASLLNLGDRINSLSEDARTSESGHDLACAAQARSALERHRGRTEAVRAKCEVRIATQQNKVRTAETERILLDKLKIRSQQKWTVDASREVESTSSDLYLGGWNRR